MPAKPIRRKQPQEICDAIRELWEDQSLSASAIGARLGVTKNVVIGLRNRLKLPPRESPLTSGSSTRSRPNGTGRPPDRAAPVPKGPTLPALPSEDVLTPMQRKPHRGLLAAETAQEARGEWMEWTDMNREDVPLVDSVVPSRPIRSAGLCCWPEGHGRGITFDCTEKATRGSYCPAHARRAYRVPGEAA
jgi:hypothetical protein